MPNTTLTCKYTIPPTGGYTAAQLATLMAGPGVGVDFDLLNLYGLTLSNDVASTSGGNAQRVLTLKMVPAIPSTASCTLSGSSIASVTVGTPGGLYSAPPVISFTGQTPQFPASAFPVMKFGGATVISGGTAYTGATVISLSGGLVPGGTQATVTPIISLGVITGVTVVTVGGPYEQPPVMTVTDSGGGSGAYIVGGLSIIAIAVSSPGLGYGPAAPSVTITPLFKASNPDSSNQAAPVRNWMRRIIEQAVRTTSLVTDPVVS